MQSEQGLQGLQAQMFYVKYAEHTASGSVRLRPVFAGVLSDVQKRRVFGVASSCCMVVIGGGSEQREKFAFASLDALEKLRDMFSDKFARGGAQEYYAAASFLRGICEKARAYQGAAVLDGID